MARWGWKLGLCVFFVIFSSLAFVGCDGIADLAKEISEQLNIPVVVLTNDEDPCAKLQVRNLVREFDSLSDTDKEHFKANFNKAKQNYHYEKIALAASEAVGSMVGEISYLEFWQQYRNGAFRHPYYSRRRVALKRINDDSKVIDGKYPATKIEKSAELRITTQVANWSGRVFNYFTYDSDLYAKIQKPSDPLLEKGLDDGSITVSVDIVTRNNPDKHCGNLVRLKDML